MAVTAFPLLAQLNDTAPPAWPVSGFKMGRHVSVAYPSTYATVPVHLGPV